MEKPTCTSCKKEITNQQGTTRFQCPNCAKYELTRCLHCRKAATKYYCPACNFEGPN